jgi:hypothetical protein
MSTYLEKLAKLLNIKGDEAEKLLDASDISELVSLTVAVNNNDKQAGLDIMHKIEGKTNFFIGEPVNVNGEKATVIEPDAPGNTMKISKGGVPEMVDKKDVEKIEEAVGFKLKWRINEKPTGQYRSFAKRQFPGADYPNGKIAVAIRCEDSYVPANVKSGEHKPLDVLIADWNNETTDGRPTFRWRKLKKQFATLGEAKTAATEFLAKHPEFHPKDEPKKIEEGVIGMTSIPGIDRMKVLAGIKPQGSVGPGETNDPNNSQNSNATNVNSNSPNTQQQEVPNNERDLPNDIGKLKDMILKNNENVKEEVQYISLQIAEQDVCEVCLNAIETLENNIDELKVGDLSEVRSRLLKLYNHLNESVSFTGRQKKV